ncbi:MAG: hypothetical protein L6Q76_31045, partial [Polyangiaceae bacterium]|nr:hypothetical protein [Polyangiaceae bacterium]
TADVGIDLGTPVVEAIGSEKRSKFTGRIPKVTVEVREGSAKAARRPTRPSAMRRRRSRGRPSRRDEPRETQEESVDRGWLHPVAGAQLFLPLSRSLEIQLRVAAGGFGAGRDFTRQALARLNWQASKALQPGVGYRALDQA